MPRDGVYRLSEYKCSDGFPLVAAAKADDATAIKAIADNTDLTPAQRDANTLWKCVETSWCELSALHVAVDLGNANAVSALLEMKGNPNAQSEDHNSLPKGPIRAAKSGALSGRSSRHFAQEGAFGLKGGRSEDEGETTFKKITDEHAIQVHQDGCYQFSDYVNKSKEDCPLLEAVKASDADAIFAIAKNDDLTPAQRDPNHQVPCVGGRGNLQTPLHVAVDLGKVAAIKALLRIGGDPEVEAGAIWGGPYDSFRFAREGALGQAGGKSPEDGEELLRSMTHMVVQLVVADGGSRWDIVNPITAEPITSLTDDLHTYTPLLLQTALKDHLLMPVRIILPNGDILRNETDLQGVVQKEPSGGY